MIDIVRTDFAGSKLKKALNKFKNTYDTYDCSDSIKVVFYKASKDGTLSWRERRMFRYKTIISKSSAIKKAEKYIAKQEAKDKAKKDKWKNSI
jgi:hypothetical protein